MAAVAGQRRVVSVLLADVADSTAIGEQLGPERSKFVFDEVTRLLAAEVKRFGGTVAQFTGDGLYALFGAPIAHDDDAERAVRAALAIQNALTGYGADVAEAYGVRLAARVGVNTGPVVLLPDEAPPEERYNALGDTVNVAARLQTHAADGGVVIGPATATNVAPAFELESLGDVELKGKTQPVEAFRVTGEREGAPARITPLVGRERELAALDEVFGDLVDGRGAIVVVTGEPGIGKSRLAAEIRARWDDRVRFLFAQGVSYAQDVPYYPLRELLRAFLGLGVADPEARVRLELKTQLAAVLADRSDTHYPFLASLLGLRLEDDAAERLRTLARDSVQRQTHEAVLELARGLARDRPLALVLEDLHFADEPTLELFEELLSLADEESIALLLLYRNDPDLRSWDLGEAARRRYRHRLCELQLEPLDPSEGAQLAAAATGGDLSEQLAEQLAERTGGNPLFLEEAARDALERGDGDAVPAAIQEILQARLERLSPEVREVAAAAAVVGRTFGTPLLERVVEPERVRPALSELQRLDLVVEERRRPTPEYRFRHGLVREAVYTSLLEQTRRELHHVVGTALEELQRDELSEAYGLLALHFSNADEPEKAAHYLLAAGDAARAVYADEEATAHYRRALSFLDRLGDNERARRVLFKIALAHHVAFDFDATNAAWQEAFARPEPPVVRLEPTEMIETAMLPPESWIPGYGYDILAWSFAPNVFSGLMRFERGLDVVPDVATHASVAPDGRTYTFRLREGLLWSDGEPLTADDFAFTYHEMCERSVPSAHLLENVDARATDPQTLELRFAEPRGHMLYLLAQLGFFPWPRHRVEAPGASWGESSPDACNGAFLLEQPDAEHAVLTANPLWHGGRGNVGRISIDIADLYGKFDEWLQGRMDLMLAPPLRTLDGIGDTPVIEIPLLTTAHLQFSAAPPFDDVRVRKAFAHALDREPLVRGITARPASGGFLPPAMPGHSHDLALRYDVAQAHRLLVEAGYPGGEGFPEVRLIHLDPGGNEAFRRSVGERWAAQWVELGVHVRQEWVPFARMPEERNRPGSMVDWGWISDYPDPNGMLGTFIEAQSTIRDDEVVRLLDAAHSSQSRDERLDLFRRADARVVADLALLVPTYYDAWHVLHRPWIEGVWTHPGGIGPLNDLVVTRPG